MSKIAEEMFALQLGKRYKIPTVAMRYSIVQGSRQSFYNAYSGACRIFSLAFHQGKEPQIYEDGNQVRDNLPIKKIIVASSQAALGEGLYLDSLGNEVLPDTRLEENLEKGIFDLTAEDGGELFLAKTPERISNPQNPYGMSKIAEELSLIHI